METLLELQEYPAATIFTTTAAQGAENHFARLWPHYRFLLPKKPDAAPTVPNKSACAASSTGQNAENPSPKCRSHDLHKQLPTALRT